MGKTKEDSKKIAGKSQAKGRMQFKFQKSKQEKPKSKKQSKAAELLEQKKQAKLEKERKAVQYKKKRLEKTKVISKKTSRGQPLMKNRIEYLLKQIQEMKRS